MIHHKSGQRTRVRMLFLGGISSFRFWRLRCLVLKSLKRCMPKMKTSRRFLSRVQATPTVHFMSKRDSFLREPGYAYQNVALENSLSNILHAGALAGHFGVEKTCSMLKEHYYWPRMSKDVEHFVKRCSTCQVAKSRVNRTVCTPHCLCP